MGRCLLGVETESAVTAFDASGVPVDRERIVHHLRAAAAAMFSHAQDMHGSGVFLQNGSRFYIDCGLHPELATPECTNPTDLVRYILAGERTLSRLATRVRDAHVSGGRVFVFRCNVDYSGGGSTWGCHESYLHRADPAVMAAQIIPHLVTRLVFTGAGGFNPMSPGLEFSLSPRVAHIVLPTSTESTVERGIFHTKNEPLCGGGYRRLHVLCGDSACSEIATWLKVGTTALVVALVEAGMAPGQAVRLRHAVAAMKTVAGDPDCAAPLALRRSPDARAVDIQRHYLRTAEAHLGEAFMPAWAEEVCRAWRTVLDDIENNRQLVAKQLDWAMKHPLYGRYAQQRGFTWETMWQWTRALEAWQGTRHIDTSLELSGAREVSSRRNPGRGPALARHLREHGLSHYDLPAFLTLRRELFEVDTRFGELGECGVFAALDASGELAHHVPGVDRVEEAVTKPPGEGRAALRGAVIGRPDGKGPYVCDWPWIWDWRARRVLDLSDPFETTERWRDVTGNGAPSGVRAISEARARAPGSLAVRRGDGATAGHQRHSRAASASSSS